MRYYMHGSFLLWYLSSLTNMEAQAHVLSGISLRGTAGTAFERSCFFLQDAREAWGTAKQRMRLARPPAVEESQDPAKNPSMVQRHPLSLSLLFAFGAKGACDRSLLPFLVPFDSHFGRSLLFLVRVFLLFTLYVRAVWWQLGVVRWFRVGLAC